MDVRPVEPRRLYRQIADQIRALIGKGEAAPGERLPAERELARRLHVSRPSLREALIALELEGLLDVRVGSGIYVTHPGGRRRAAEVSGESGPFEVMRARRLIEGECATLAARGASPAQLRAIRAAHAHMLREAKRNHNPLEADRAFHMRIAEAGGNSALVLTLQTLWDQRMGPLYRALEKKLEYPAMAAETLREHRAILAAIARRDAGGARASMRRHMDMTMKRYTKEWGKEDSMAAVTLKAIRKSFGAHEVVHGVDISIADGEFCVLVGPSGCGKSTLLRMIAGLEEITSGEVRIGGRLVNNVEPKERDIAMVFQNYALYPHMTVYENMGFSLTLAGESKDAIRRRVEEAAQILGLMDYLGRYPRQLSGGQRQRVAMGRAIVRKPQVFLFDEPLSNLDAKLRVAMRTEIKGLHQRLKTTSVYVTHDQIEAMTMADKIVVMNGGGVEQVGSPLDLYDNPANLFVAGFIGSPAMNFLSGRVAVNGAGFEIRLGEGVAVPAPSACTEQGREIIVGVRPEHLAVADEGISAEVELVEPTGADTQIFCKFAGADLSAVVRERHEFRPGERIRLKPQFTFIFDPASGARLV